MRAYILTGPEASKITGIDIKTLFAPAATPKNGPTVYVNLTPQTYDDLYKVYHYAVYPRYLDGAPAVFAVPSLPVLYKKLQSIPDPPPVSCPLTGEKLIRHLSRLPQVKKMPANLNFAAKIEPVVEAPLDPDQTAAAAHFTGPALVVAPAGSGKTMTVTARVMLLTMRGIDPARILCLTFTKKAQGEMQERLIYALGKTDGAKVTVRTYHSLAYTLIGEITGKKPKIIPDRRPVLAELLEKSEARLDVDDLDEYISLHLNSLQGPEDVEPGNEREKQFAEIYSAYMERMEKDGFTDQDNLLFTLYRLLRDDPAARARLMDYAPPGADPKHPKGRWQFVLVDEAQDNNLAQDVLTRFLAAPWDNIYWVGDEDQCLLPDTLIATKQGAIAIKDIKYDNELIVANGHGTTTTVKPEKVMSKYYSGPIVKIVTSSGKQLTGTPEHCVFARMIPEKERHLVYLMYSKRLGYRIGRTSTVRSNYKGSVKGLANGHHVRLRQEKGNAIWILEVCDKLEDACFYEQYYSIKYGLPTCVFHTNGRRMSITQELVDKLFNSINTRERAYKLMQDKLLNPEEPHYSPQARTIDNRGARKLHFTMFGSSRVCYGGSRWHKPFELHNHELSYNTIDAEFARIGMKYMGNSIKSTAKGTTYWNGRVSNGNYDSLWQIMQKMKEEVPDLALEIKAKLTDKRYKFMPLSHVRKGMLVPVLSGDIVVEEEVISVEFSQYNGYVYDINVPYYRNYIAGGIVVHNCLYSFRGSDIKRILSLKNNYPCLKELYLKTNYRSLPAIVKAADELIRHNEMRRQKTIVPAREGTGVLEFFAFDNLLSECEWVAAKITGLLSTGKNPEDIAVLYRTNAQADAFAEVFNGLNVPYFVHRTGRPLFETAEAQVLLDYLTLLDGSDDPEVLLSVLQVPPRAKKPDRLVEALENVAYPLDTLRAAAESLKEWKVVEFCDDLRTARLIARNLPDAGQIARYARLRFELDKYFSGSETSDRLNILEAIAAKFEAPEDFVAWVKKARARKKNGDARAAGKVQLMTVHSAKGLEFPAVFLVNCTEGHFPHLKAKTAEEIEEERRIFYVGMTRAMDALYVSGYETEERPLSRFLREAGLTMPNSCEEVS